MIAGKVIFTLSNTCNSGDIGGKDMSLLKLLGHEKLVLMQTHARRRVSPMLAI